MLKSAVVTGAGSGIGRAIAIRLAGAGLTVLAVGRRFTRLTDPAGMNKNIQVLSADITRYKDIERIVSIAGDLQKPLCLVHGAGMYQVGKLLTLDQSHWQQSFNINVTARLALMQAMHPLMNKGRVLFIGSDAAENVRHGAGAYSIAQAASQALVKTLKKELTELKIASFKPGLVRTEMVENFIHLSEEEFHDVKVYNDYIARGNILLPETVADFMKWLLLEVNDKDFAETPWDIREEWHHKHWLKNNLNAK